MRQACPPHKLKQREGAGGGIVRATPSVTPRRDTSLKEGGRLPLWGRRCPVGTVLRRPNRQVRRWPGKAGPEGVFAGKMIKAARSADCSKSLVFSPIGGYTRGNKTLRKGVAVMLKAIRNSLVLLALLYIVLGVVLILFPATSLNLACLLIGAVTLLYGVGAHLRLHPGRGGRGLPAGAGLWHRTGRPGGVPPGVPPAAGVPHPHRLGGVPVGGTASPPSSAPWSGRPWASPGGGCPSWCPWSWPCSAW